MDKLASDMNNLLRDLPVNAHSAIANDGISSTYSSEVIRHMQVSTHHDCLLHHVTILPFVRQN